MSQTVFFFRETREKNEIFNASALTFLHLSLYVETYLTGPRPEYLFCIIQILIQGGSEASASRIIVLYVLLFILYNTVLFIMEPCAALAPDFFPARHPLCGILCLTTPRA